MKNLIKKYKEIILYIVFGAGTVLVNTMTYNLLYYCFSVPNIPSNVVAWIMAVLFAFFTNKFFVFNSKNKSLCGNVKEAILFFLCRLGTEVVDLVIMYLAVDCFESNAFLWKIIANVVVIVINYIASKLFIFDKS